MRSSRFGTSSPVQPRLVDPPPRVERPWIELVVRSNFKEAAEVRRLLQARKLWMRVSKTKTRVFMPRNKKRLIAVRILVEDRPWVVALVEAAFRTVLGPVEYLEHVLVMENDALESVFRLGGIEALEQLARGDL